MTLIETLTADVQSLLFLALLILAFIVAFKIMEMIFETILVAVLSAVFYLSLVYFLGFQFTLDRVLLFAFLGASFYMTYSFLASAYTIASTVISIPYHAVMLLAESIHRPLKRLWEELEELAGGLEHRMEKKAEADGQEGDSEEDNNVKEVVLDKVKDDTEQDEGEDGD